VPISEAIANIKTVPAIGQLVRTARDTGISFGAPDEARYHRQPINKRRPFGNESEQVIVSRH
jgi:hypothetical protein